MIARYPGKCAKTGRAIRPGDSIVMVNRRPVLTRAPDTRVIFYGEHGATTLYRNPAGRCEDSPCCGCCTV